MKCSECNGTGKYDTGFSLPEACRECKGSGQVAETADNSSENSVKSSSNRITAAWSFNAQPGQFKDKSQIKGTF